MQPRNSFEIKLLSVVMPAYKQQGTIIKDIKKIKKTLDELGCPYELIIVVDGVVDRTYERASQLKDKDMRILCYPKNEGKGHAVRYGMMHAKGDVIGFIDAGMDINPNGFRMLLNHMEWYNADVIIGSKLHPVSKVDYPLYRTILSWGYRTLTWMLFGFMVKDTQVGLKFFRRKVVRKVLPKLLVKRYAFDIEILAVTYAYGYKRIYEAPVKINFRQNVISSRKLPKIVYLMIWDTIAVFYRLRFLRYYTYKKKKERISAVKKFLFSFSR